MSDPPVTTRLNVTWVLPPCASQEVPYAVGVVRLSEGLCPGCASRLTIKGAYGYCPATPDHGIGWSYDGNANVVNVAVTHNPVP